MPEFTRENRKHARHPARGRVSLERPEYAESPEVQVELRDVSNGGLAGVCGEEIHVGSTVRVGKTAAGMAWPATVTRCTPCGEKEWLLACKLWVSMNDDDRLSLGIHTDAGLKLIIHRKLLEKLADTFGLSGVGDRTGQSVEKPKRIIIHRKLVDELAANVDLRSVSELSGAELRRALEPVVERLVDTEYPWIKGFERAHLIDEVLKMIPD